MKIVRPYARITPDSIAHVPWAGMRHIEWASRISHRSEDAQSPDSWRRFVQSVVLDHGDWSVVEHVSVSVDAVVDRGITHEWIRHRLFSFTQESTRFVNYEKKMPPSFIYPKTEVECEFCLCGNEVQAGTSLLAATWWHSTPNNPNTDGASCAYDPLWLSAIQIAEQRYRSLMANSGWRPQEARSVLPNALASRIVITGNLRNWRHFFIMRTTSETHPQFRQVSIPLLIEFKSRFPLLFDDIEPLTKQSTSIARPR